MTSTYNFKIPLDSPDFFTPSIKREPLYLKDEFWFIFKDAKLLIEKTSYHPIQRQDLLLTRDLYLGTYKDLHIYAGELSSLEKAPPDALAVDLRYLHNKMDDAFFSLAGRARQLILWDLTHQFCGQCGSKTIDRLNERAKECPSCGLLNFPKISPAIMVLIQKDEEILLARSPHFPKGIYSVLSGFVDPGETLENCVKREVLEEVGLHVDNIEYFSSQPWPFPSSLMIAFTCKWVCGEIKVDPSEIEEARWFKKDNLPLLFPEISISRMLIDSIQ